MSMKYLLAILFGVLVTLLGLFAGLQIAPIFGNILAFPFVLAAQLAGQGFGNLPAGVLAFLFVLTSLFWAAAFVLVGRATKRMAR